MTEDDPIRARFGNDKAHTFENDAAELNRQEIRQRMKDQDTWFKVDGVDDPEMDNPYIVQG